jgi:hypothetical protein
MNDQRHSSDAPVCPGGGQFGTNERLIQAAGDRIVVTPGGSVDTGNVQTVLRQKEFGGQFNL